MQEKHQRLATPLVMRVWKQAGARVRVVNTPISAIWLTLVFLADSGGEPSSKEAGSKDVAQRVGDSQPQLRDLTQVPATLDALFEKLHVAGAVRPMVLTPASTWFRSMPAYLGSNSVSQDALNPRRQRVEKDLCFDLLDALSKVGDVQAQLLVLCHVLCRLGDATCCMFCFVFHCAVGSLCAHVHVCL
jgi:hypothetical protein